MYISRYIKYLLFTLGSTILLVNSCAYASSTPTKVYGYISNSTQWKYILTTPVKYATQYSKLPNDYLYQAGSVDNYFQFDWLLTSKATLVGNNAIPSDAASIQYVHLNSDNSKDTSNMCTFYYSTYYNNTPCWMDTVVTGTQLKCKAELTSYDQTNGICNVKFSVVYSFTPAKK